MLDGKWKAWLWSTGMKTSLYVTTCLWLSLGCIVLLASNGYNSELVPDVECQGLEQASGEELSWAVHLQAQDGEHSQQALHKLADELAQVTGLVSRGQIGELKDHYLFSYEGRGRCQGETEAIRKAVAALFAQHDSVRWHSEQKPLKRYKRSLHFNDPKYPQQWHLNNSRRPGMDINVTGVWERNVTGRGVTVVVVDDGVEHTIQDIEPNYCPEGSYDLNSNDPDPMPHPDNENDNHHGTRCAGEIAAVPNNSFCAVGVAYGSRIAGIRVLDGPLTDSMEAIAFNKHYQINDIYSCSWGPDDDGKTVDGPHQLGKIALQHGVIAGRKGFGSIFVVASGNGGRYLDNCNYDGYANSIYTVTIGAVDEAGQMPFYAEECASMLAVTFSSGDQWMRSIVTSDWKMMKGTGCTEGHTGTSAAAPLAAGMIALMLEVRPCLTWRDVQHIIVFTATKYNDLPSDWEKNGAGFSHSHKHGFGLLSAWRLTNAAKIWDSVPYLASYVSPVLKEDHRIPLVPGRLEITWNVTAADLELTGMRTLEHVALTVTITHPRRGNLEISLYCPSGMSSLLGATRITDADPSGFQDWTFSTVRCWGENAEGTYRVIITDIGNESLEAGTLKQWQLLLYGSSWTTEEVKERQRLVEEAMGGQYLNQSYSLPCPPGMVIPEQEIYMITNNTLKTLMLFGCFAVFWSVYYMLEVYLTRKNVDFELSCGSWSKSSRRHRALEAGMVTEAVPLCGLKDGIVEEVEDEREAITSRMGAQGDWNLRRPKPHRNNGARSLQQASSSGTEICIQDLTSDLLLPTLRETQEC
uniref:Proprotein convertase subtilisin/kexin type 7 n=1 Tax=Geotrypetes seraphini TaxID=260995 RepID=A0A6P8NV41_GEOSA|nr:proprotein convertase subtilisin/kexin type 7 [Geotrypetes seraphini]